MMLMKALSVSSFQKERESYERREHLGANVVALILSSLRHLCVGHTSGLYYSSGLWNSCRVRERFSTWTKVKQEYIVIIGKLEVCMNKARD